MRKKLDDLGVKAYANRKKIFIFFGAIILLLLLIIIITSKNSRNIKETNDSSQNSEVLNPLINGSELKRVKKSLNKPISGNEDIKYKFHYELDSSLKKEFSFNIFSKVFSANDCNISSLPLSVAAYKLKAHYSSDDAKKYAGEYSVDPSTLSSLPDGSTSFDYYFSDPKSSSYFTLAEPSGTTYFHSENISNSAPDINDQTAKNISSSSLSKHSLSTDLVPINSLFNSSSSQYTFSYRKKFPLKMVDSGSISELGKSGNLCEVSESKNMNTIQIAIGKKGDLLKLRNQTRYVLSSYTFTRQSLDDSLIEYKDTPPVDPIVIGKTPSTGTVIIDSAVMVYFDYGEYYGQEVYLPVYLTSGKTSTGARVLTVFPSVAQKDLDISPVSPKEINMETLQMQTFNPAPPPPAGKLCYGNLIDYDLQCAHEGQVICSGYVSIPTGKGDPLDICSTGCQVKTGTINVTSGSDPCSEFMIQSGIDGNYGDISGVNGKHNLPNFQGGSVSCTLHGCPC